ncbi:stage II sporulation protein M [Paenibacillus assamensis]|uniref:stage II sporulation protein M n=1 Tax=Paenibacillus assamensis TaxID=311244 RepID=UPI001FDF9EB5|nr:stage II sporulation protein M [Paenibacillus assamensis]
MTLLAIMPDIKKHLYLYVFVTLIFVVGVVFGALLVNSLTYDQQEELSRQLEQIFLTAGDSADTTEFWSSLWMYWRWILLIAVLGISIVGFPLILILDFAKGVLIGFTVGTLVSQFSWKGMFVALLGVAPHNMIAIPLMLIASVSALSFAIHVMKDRLFVPKMRSLKKPFLDYLTTQVGVCIGMMAVAVIMTWVSPYLMNWMSSSIIDVESALKIS